MYTAYQCIAVYVGTTVVSGRKHRQIVVKCTYGISCHVDMAASARPPFAIHGQICTATRHNKRRPAARQRCRRRPSIFSIGSTPKTHPPPDRCCIAAQSAHAHAVVLHFPISRRREFSHSHAFRAQRRDAIRPPFRLVQ